MPQPMMARARPPPPSRPTSNSGLLFLPLLLLLLLLLNAAAPTAAATAAAAAAEPAPMQEYALGNQGRVLLRVRPEPWEVEIVKKQGAGGNGTVVFRTVLARRSVLDVWLDICGLWVSACNAIYRHNTRTRMLTYEWLIWPIPYFIGTSAAGWALGSGWERT